MKTLVIGLDCAAPEILLEDERLTTLRHLMQTGCYGRLESVVPPITVPAWMCMSTSRDPGSLGVYGFRNRADRSYDRLSIVNSRSIRAVAAWDQVAMEGKIAHVIGVPPNYPPRKTSGVSVGCFLTPDTARGDFIHPASHGQKIQRLVGEYPVDVRGFRTHDKDWLHREIVRMTRAHFEVIRHYMQTTDWDYLQFVEIGLDRIQHGFWKYHDTTHRRHPGDSPHKNVIREYYQLLDEEVGSLLELLDEETNVLVLSDHGAQRLDGGFCINQWLIEEGLLVLHEYPQTPTPLSEVNVDWERTKAWGEGGYYARVFLNVRGREPQGTLEPGDCLAFREELAARIEALPDDRGRRMKTRVFLPEETYRETRNVPRTCSFTSTTCTGGRSAASGIPRCTCRRTTPDRTTATTPNMGRSSWPGPPARWRASGMACTCWTSRQRSSSWAVTTSRTRCRGGRFRPASPWPRSAAIPAATRRSFATASADWGTSDERG